MELATTFGVNCLVPQTDSAFHPNPELVDLRRQPDVSSRSRITSELRYRGWTNRRSSAPGSWVNTRGLTLNAFLRGLHPR
jgi:hypothetical protein